MYLYSIQASGLRQGGGLGGDLPQLFDENMDQRVVFFWRLYHQPGCDLWDTIPEAFVTASSWYVSSHVVCFVILDGGHHE